MLYRNFQCAQIRVCGMQQLMITMTLRELQSVLFMIVVGCEGGRCSGVSGYQGIRQGLGQLVGDAVPEHIPHLYDSECWAVPYASPGGSSAGIYHVSPYSGWMLTQGSVCEALGAGAQHSRGECISKTVKETYSHAHALIIFKPSCVCKTPAWLSPSQISNNHW